MLTKSVFTPGACWELAKLVCLIDWQQIKYEGYAIGPAPWSFLCQLARNAAQNWDGHSAVAPLIEIVSFLRIVKTETRNLHFWSMLLHYHARMM